MNIPLIKIDHPRPAQRDGDEALCGRSVVAPEQVFGVILQAFEGIDTPGAGADLVPDVIRQGIKILLGFRGTGQEALRSWYFIIITSEAVFPKRGVFT